MNDKKIKQAALEFAQGQPVQWDAFLVKWEAEHSEPAETVTLKPEVAETSATSPEPTVEVQETTDAVEVSEVKKRKAAPRKAKAAES